MLVPGGFGDRGVQGKILAATYARENGVPYLGICLGMQLAVVEFARNVCILFSFTYISDFSVVFCNYLVMECNDDLNKMDFYFKRCSLERRRVKYLIPS